MNNKRQTKYFWYFWDLNFSCNGHSLLLLLRNISFLEGFHLVWLIKNVGLYFGWLFFNTMEERQPKKYFEFMWEILIFLHVNPSMCVYFLKSKLVHHHHKDEDFVINFFWWILDGNHSKFVHLFMWLNMCLCLKETTIFWPFKNKSMCCICCPSDCKGVVSVYLCRLFYLIQINFLPKMVVSLSQQD